MADTTDGSIGAFHKTNCGSASSGFSSLHNSAYPNLRNDPNMDALRAILQNNESRLTFQLFTRVIESRVQLSWIPSVICSCKEPIQSGFVDAETPDSDEFSRMEFLRSPKISPQPIPPPSSSNYQYTINSKTAEIAINLVNTFESHYADDYESLVGDALRIHSSASATNSSSSSETEVDLNSLCNPYPSEYATLRARYIKILDSLFVSQINWGRIVAMISFLRALCTVLDTTPGSQSSLSSVDDPISVAPQITNLQLSILHYIIWTTEFIHKESKLGEWIKEHGGWDGLDTFVHGGETSVYSHFVSIFVGASVLLFAPIGFASAIGFVLRRLWPR